MSEAADFDATEAALPGLGAPPRSGVGANEAAARRTLVALQADAVIGEQHAVMMEALLTAARQLDRAATSAKAKDYGVANLLAQLRETYLVLAPAESEGGESDPFEDFKRELVAAEQRRAAAVRHTSES